MKKKIILSISFLSIMMMLSGCCISHEFAPATCTEPPTCIKCGYTEGEALGHEWVEATCTVPKTCSRCGETEGEALGHNLTKATYQDAPVCKVCNETIGDVLTPGFVEHKIKIDTEKMDESVELETRCYTDSTKNTVGSFCVKDFKLIDDDKVLEKLEQKRGYTWASCNLHMEFSDKNAYDYGVTWNLMGNDYYDIELCDDTCKYFEEDGCDTFTVNYLGKNWDKCEIIYNPENKNVADWNNDTFVVDYYIYIRMPKEYDGVVFSASDGSLEMKDGMYIYDLECDDKQIATIKLPAFK